MQKGIIVKIRVVKTVLQTKNRVCYNVFATRNTRTLEKQLIELVPVEGTITDARKSNKIKSKTGVI